MLKTISTINFFFHQILWVKSFIKNKTTSDSMLTAYISLKNPYENCEFKTSGTVWSPSVLFA